ncbi:GNAT family N-acetyltransferase [Flexivirga meconopsidis]|uniref:GNAT family N-acetyltransferase n=1 Tax=Flexivirga meconopsidis TaxID=2977121 RepID=UPI00223F3709|nr:GNAT family N-acetyltransferase [Flexivirga meconopsidis]
MTTVRDFQPADAGDVAELFNRHRDVPNPVTGGITADQLLQELADRDTETFLVAETDGRLVGTFGLFRSDGRRVAGPGELIADMFFVAPEYRRGTLTAALFGDAVERMVGTEFGVLRLTVNPANTAAYTLYRRVGCVAIDRTVPGADGNVQLCNYLPLVLQQIHPTLPTHIRDRIRDQATTRFIPRALPTHLDGDLEVTSDGRRTVRVPFAISDFEIDTVIDIDRKVVLSAQMDGYRYEAPSSECDAPISAPTADAVAVSAGDLLLRVNPDGSAEVSHPDHLGPVFTSLWPTAGRGRVTGWRAGHPRTLTVERRPDGVTVAEELEDGRIECHFSLTPDALFQRFVAENVEPQLLLRSYHLAGLRTGWVRVSTSQEDRTDPIGDGLGVRDTGQLPAAQRLLQPGSQIRWHQDDFSRDITVTADVTGLGVVTSTMLERRFDPSDDPGLRIHFGMAQDTLARAGETGSVDALPGRTDAQEAHAQTARSDAAAGGVIGWKPFARNVFRSAHPRSRSFAHNPRWSAGVWVTRDVTRESRSHGIGWGVPEPGRWSDEAGSLRYEGLSLRAVSSARAGIAALTVAVADSTPAADGELVVWLTPDSPSRADAVCWSPGGTPVIHPLGERWQRWASAVDLPLRDGRWLHIDSSDAGGDHPEILVRSTESGPLVGCLTRSGCAQQATATWRFAVLNHPLDATENALKQPA